MKKRLPILFFFCYLSLVVFAQKTTVVDSLWMKYAQSEQDTIKAGILCDISYLYYSTNADSALVLCQSGLDILAKEEPTTARGVCLMNMGLAYSVKGDKFSALEYFFLAKDFFLTTNAEQSLTDCLINIGMAEFNLNDIDKAIDYTLQALEIAENNNNTIHKGSCYQNLGLFNKQKENLASALDYFQKALSLKRNSKSDPRLIANSLDAIAGVYVVMGNTESAYQYYKEALDLREESGDVIGYVLSYYNIGVFYHTQKDFSRALEHYEIALAKSNELKIPALIAYCLDAIGNAYTDLGKPTQGIKYIKESLQIRRDMKDDSGCAHTLINLTDAYQKKGDVRMALKTAELFEKLRNVATFDDKLNLEMTLQDIWIGKGNYEKAFYHLKAVKKIEHAKDSTANQKVLAETKAAFEFDMSQKDHDLELKDKESVITNLRVANTNYANKIFKWGIFILICLLGFILYNYVQKRIAHREVAEKNIELEEKNIKIFNSNKKLQESNQKLEVSNNSLQQFTFAASHDLKESLRTITSFSQIIKSELPSENADNSETQGNVDFIISSGKKMHKTLEDLLSYVNLNFTEAEDTDCFITDVIKECEEDIFDEVDFNYSIKIHSPIPELYAKQAKVFQLFYNIIENSKEYCEVSRPLEIKVGYELKKGDHIFSISDNGIGIELKYLNYIFEPFKRLGSREKSGSGLGLAVCKKIVEMYGGNIWASSDGENGTTIYFTIPSAIKK